MSAGGVVGIGWVVDAPKGESKSTILDRGLSGKGSYSSFAYGGGSLSLSQTDDNKIKMLSFDVGKTKGGSKDKIFGFDAGLTNMKPFDLSKLNMKYDKSKNEYVYDNNRGFELEL